MPQIPYEYTQVAHDLITLANAITIRQKAVEIALRSAGVSEEQWAKALEEATRSISWAVAPESSTGLLQGSLQTLLAKLVGS